LLLARVVCDLLLDLERFLDLDLLLDLERLRFGPGFLLHLDPPLIRPREHLLDRRRDVERFLERRRLDFLLSILNSNKSLSLSEGGQYGTSLSLSEKVPPSASAADW
jgi:hypothetical protein